MYLNSKLFILLHPAKLLKIIHLTSFCEADIREFPKRLTSLPITRKRTTYLPPPTYFSKRLNEYSKYKWLKAQLFIVFNMLQVTSDKYLSIYFICIAFGMGGTSVNRADRRKEPSASPVHSHIKHTVTESFRCTRHSLQKGRERGSLFHSHNSIKFGSFLSLSLSLSLTLYVFLKNF